MNEAYLRRQIAYHENQLSQLRAINNDLNNRLNDLITLRGRFAEIRNDFGYRQQMRSSAVSRLSKHRSTSRVARRFQDGMGNMLSGSASRAAANDLNNGAQRIEHEIRVTSQRIENNRQQIVRERNYINNLYNQLRQSLN